MFPAASGNLNAGVGNGNGQQEQITEAGNGDGGGVSPSPVDSGATAVSIGARLSKTSDAIERYCQLSSRRYKTWINSFK